MLPIRSASGWPTTRGRLEIAEHGDIGADRFDPPVGPDQQQQRTGLDCDHLRSATTELDHALALGTGVRKPMAKRFQALIAAMASVSATRSRSSNTAASCLIVGVGRIGFGDQRQRFSPGEGRTFPARRRNWFRAIPTVGRAAVAFAVGTSLAIVHVDAIGAAVDLDARSLIRWNSSGSSPMP